MLNKELLMAGEVEPHIWLTVGKYINDLGINYFGYLSSENTPFGSISRIPLFIDSEGNEFRIKGIYAFHTYQTHLLANKYLTYTIKVTVSSENYTFSFNNSDTSIIRDLVFSGSDVGTTLPVYFDPPPDGYLDPETLKPI